jgi:hypothetical protein
MFGGAIPCPGCIISPAESEICRERTIVRRKREIKFASCYVFKEFSNPNPSVTMMLWMIFFG